MDIPNLRDECEGTGFTNARNGAQDLHLTRMKFIRKRPRRGSNHADLVIQTSDQAKSDLEAKQRCGREGLGENRAHIRLTFPNPCRKQGNEVIDRHTIDQAPEEQSPRGPEQI